MNEPWFVRIRRPMSYKIMPCRWQGWAVTAAYVAITLAIAPLAAADQWLACAVLFAVASFTYGLVMWRTSIPIEEMNNARK